jgi:pentatricopeptide repeat protein
MLSGPNHHTYGALINGFVKLGQMEAVKMLMTDMQCRGVGFNQVIFNTMLDGYVRKGLVEKALELTSIMEKTSIESDTYTNNTLG